MDHSEGKMITGLRDASFSCYLTTPAEVNSFAAKLTEPETHSKPLESEQIGVFRAEKYFNMRLEDARRSPRIIDTITGKYVKESDAVDVRKMRKQVGRIIPSVSSEASWSSQSALLKRSSKSSFFHGFSCKGSCSDKKSIQNIDVHGGRKQAVEEVAHNAAKWEAARKVQSSSSRFQNPNGIQRKKAPLVEEGRKSLEVFGSQSMKKEDNISVDLQRKLSVLTWDAIPNPTQQANKLTKPDNSLDEVASDASSDLFEIETASGSTRVFTNYKKSCEEGGYEPSEASVEWSVVTASAAAATDFSFASECAASQVTGNSVPPKGKTKYNGILLSCKSHEAVDVADAAQQHKGKQFSGISVQRR
ncbi:Protein PHYTOCHROME KINASE SUBSTRATE 1 [Linum grandiflorum]